MAFARHLCRQAQRNIDAWRDDCFGAAVCSTPNGKSGSSKTGVERFAFQRQDSEDSFMYAAQRLAGEEAP